MRLQVYEGRLHALTLTYTGEIWPHLVDDITFSIPNFVALDLVMRAGNGYKATNTAETAARLEMVEKVRVFARQQEREYNSLSKSFHNLYDLIRHPDPDKWTDATIAEAARSVDLRRPPPVLTLFALHTYMMSRPHHFVADPLNHRSSQRFSVRPLAQVERLNQVASWTRPPSPEFQSFMTKARDAFARLQQAKALHGDEIPQMVDLGLKPWSDTDLVFIHYLRDSLRTTRSIQKDPYTFCVSAILKNLNLYTETISSALTYRFLCDIGHIAPWKDIIMEDPQIQMVSSLEGNTAEKELIDDLLRFNMENPATNVPDTIKKELFTRHLTGSSELYTRDLHADVRHDFGSLPAYVIDDEGAQELDDAISIERIPDDPTSFWVHVHVADPTTALPPGHVVDICAQKLGSTRYASHQTWPMLPDALVSKFSLGNLPEGAPQPVLSFSFKISEDGAFLDYKIRSGLIRNIQILLYDQIDEALGVATGVKHYPFESEYTRKKTYGPIIEPHLSDLRTLFQLSKSIVTRKIKETSMFVFSLPKAEVTFNDKFPKSTALDRPMLWTGYPSMTYAVRGHNSALYGSRETVTQFMILACRVASRFCLDNGIPAIRRAAPQASLKEEVLNEILNLRNDYGIVDVIECIKRDVYLYPSEATLEPKEHFPLGVPEGEGYCRATSPLRRYGDLLMHWQIKHALLPASQQTSSSRALFPAETLQTLAWQLHGKDVTLSKMARLHDKYWCSAYVHRFITRSRQLHGEGHNPFPDLMARSIGHPVYDPVNNATHVPVIIDRLGIQGMLRGLPKHSSSSQYPLGTPFKVKISEITLGLTPFTVVNPV